MAHVVSRRDFGLTLSYLFHRSNDVEEEVSLLMELWGFEPVHNGVSDKATGEIYSGLKELSIEIDDLVRTKNR